MGYGPELWSQKLLTGQGKTCPVFFACSGKGRPTGPGVSLGLVHTALNPTQLSGIITLSIARHNMLRPWLLRLKMRESAARAPTLSEIGALSNET